MAFGLRKIVSVLFIFLCFLGMSLTAEGETPERKIVIELSTFRLYLYQEGAKILEYPIAIGAPDTPTPVGDTKIVNRVYYPTYYPIDWGKKGLTPIAPGPDNPVGARWLGLGLPNYGIHGTNNPASIGKAVSDGCIRMFNEDVKELFEMVRIGTPVTIVHKKELGSRPQEQIEKLISIENPGLFVVQVGAFERRENALRRQEELKAAGFEAEIYSNNLFQVWLADRLSWLEAILLQHELERMGFSVFIKSYEE